ncbi:replication endonuclease [Alkalimonas delamerensis]|uniref:Replication endonuclease n=1 Tax=Alkalimonas delamerensis TaxID=265981 RepID=A0ABT9GTS9_9GAMM|nr:replication endonuclease [Alkalimonas delamerensis]MDP4530383.1 replication endonuclease [Alkalimonas delamerensis]
MIPNDYRQHAISQHIQSINAEFAPLFQHLDRADRIFVEQQVQDLPLMIQRLLLQQYQKEKNQFDANSYLRKTVQQIRQLLPEPLKVHFDANEDELRGLARIYAHSCRSQLNQIRQPLLDNFLKGSLVVRSSANLISETSLKIALENSDWLFNFFRIDSEIISKTVFEQCFANRDRNSEFLDVNLSSVNALLRNTPEQGEPLRTENSVNGVFRLVAEIAAYEKAQSFVNGKGLTAPKPDKTKTMLGCIERMICERWWLRKLRVLQNRTLETVMIHLGRVHRFAGIYCSDLTAKNRKYQKQRQFEMMERISIVNELDEKYSLRELYELNVSNPVNRRNELMTRMRGFEDAAKQLGHICDFVTLTCPSKYHSTYAVSGDRNPKWQQLTPQQAQQYLCGVWAKIRAEMDRQGIRVYGLRVAEPQHDGTPHWHLALFLEPEQLEAFRKVFQHYALQEDGDEKGAQENRVKFVAIDPSKGSATGYIAKYIAKNIDGANLDEDIHGGDPILTAQRVEAWASCWGIRQFQQIGGVSVTVWRELRRLKADKDHDMTLKAVHHAADSGNWKRFVLLMGGVFCKRKDQLIRPHYQQEINQDTGEVAISRYDGFIASKLKGICYLGKAIITRLHQWRLEIDLSAVCSNLEFCK